MARQITVITPENVRIEYELAGAASRAGAAIIDLTIQGLALTGVILARGQLVKHDWWPGASWADAALGVIMFLVWYGYYVYFETVWNGQTPGKRYSRLRAIREGGLPIDISCAATRNLVRVIDFLPVFYLLGIIVVIFSGRNKRLGDIAAGTLVVKERGEWMRAATPHRSAPAANHPEAALVRNIELVTREEFDAVKRFVERKAELEIHVSEQLAAKIAGPLMKSLGIESRDGLSYSNLLAEIYNRCVEERGMR
ncbi:MAG: RDD family protein [Armatimonadetes bacterium]|nr:RDD family protein [Armatimonadota bacterium]